MVDEDEAAGFAVEAAAGDLSVGAVVVVEVEVEEGLSEAVRGAEEGSGVGDGGDRRSTVAR